MLARRALVRESDIVVTNVAVRFSDRDAFLGIIRTRETLLEEACREPLAITTALERLSYAGRATVEALNADSGAELAIAHLETTAAIAISLLTDLKRKRA
ncbi:MAG: hypothetical protein MK010_00065 [Erythrobacter sp.]|nr:hypothetical protein [Erythrobacter sp.]